MSIKTDTSSDLPTAVDGAIPVQIVLGTTLRKFVFERLIPNLAASTDQNLEIHLLDYSSSHAEKTFNVAANCQVFEHSRRKSTAGFGENHNLIFERRNSRSPFIVLNPDTIVAKNSIDQLCLRMAPEHDEVALVEGRQWPFQHPKEYDSVTLQTPWASGAFVLINGDFFDEVSGFDERYFMYLEDVDLSWTAWQKGLKVLHEPSASCFHFSEGPFHREDLESIEEIYGKVNFVRLLEKFFGVSGLRHAASVLSSEFGHVEAKATFIKAGFLKAFDEFSEVRNFSVTSTSSSDSEEDILKDRAMPWIRVMGYNRFHKLRF